LNPEPVLLLKEPLRFNNVGLAYFCRPKMSKSKREEKVAYSRPVPLPGRPERPGELSWPSPTPLPTVPSEDIGKTLKMILDRLDGIEKRLENIEKTLITRQPVSQ
jgi:hypothetical protein